MLGIALGKSVLDYTITNENEIDGDWDGEWFAETSENDENWYSEFFIPWNMAPMNKQDEEKRTIGVVEQDDSALGHRNWFSCSIFSAIRVFISSS